MNAKKVGYRQVASDLLAWTAIRGYQPGDRLPSEKDIATALGANRGVVQLAIVHLIAQGQLQRHGYKLKLISGRQARTPTLPPVHVYTCSSDPLFRLGVQEIWKQHGAEVFAHPRPVTSGAWAESLAALFKTHCEGLILWPASDTTLPGDLAEICQSRHIPLVVMDVVVGDFPIIAPDHAAGIGSAVRHLLELGHKELAHITYRGDGIALRQRHDAYRWACKDAGLEASATRIRYVDSESPFDWAGLIKGLRSEGVTGCIVVNDHLAEQFLAAAASFGWKSPGQLSVIGFDNLPLCETTDPPLTSVDVDWLEMGRMAARLLAEQIEARRNGQRFPHQLRILGTSLKVRASTRPMASLPRASLSQRERPREAPAPIVDHWPLDEGARRKEVLKMWNEAYRMVKESGDQAKWDPLDLQPHCNRLRAGHGQWMGDVGLDHLPDGRLRIHGVPFLVLPDRPPHGCSALILNSKRSRLNPGETLPQEVLLKLSGKVRAIYWLHACAWAESAEPFACYEIKNNKGGIFRVPLVAFGPEDLSQRPQANVQDWFPHYRHHDGENFKSAVVTESGDPILYQRYLYTLQWINPQPEVPLTGLRLLAVAGHETTLAILAITLLRSASE